MKKLLVLTLVLGLVALANAGLVTTDLTPGFKAVVDTDAQTVTFVGTALAAGAADSVTGVGLNLYVDSGTLSFVGTTSGAGELSPGMEYPDAGYWAGYALSNTGGKIGNLFVFSYSDALATSIGIVESDFGTSEVAFFTNPTVNLVGQSIAIPEPVTMVLLGLGGLFLRKK